MVCVILQSEGERSPGQVSLQLSGLKTQTIVNPPLTNHHLQTHFLNRVQECYIHVGGQSRSNVVDTKKPEHLSEEAGRVVRNQPLTCHYQNTVL